MLKNYDEALSYFHIANNYFEEANEYGEQYLVLLTNMGIAYLGKGDFLSSKIYMDEMKDKFVQLYGSFENIKDEDQFIFWAYYGLMLQSIGHESDAEKYYLKVINNSKRTPVSFEAYLLSANNLSNIYSKNGKWEESIKILEELQGPNSHSNYVISQNLAIGYLFTNRYQEAISALYDMNECSFLLFLSILKGISPVPKDCLRRSSLVMNLKSQKRAFKILLFPDAFGP
jgi:tetratricopeptide (TPR) repeat protein